MEDNHRQGIAEPGNHYAEQPWHCVRIISKSQGTCEACIDCSESAVSADVELVAFKLFPHGKPSVVARCASA